LEGRIEVQLTDYRHVQGRFTKIVSIEMIEAVGHRHLGRYFRALDRLLTPGGRIVLQAITMPDQKYRAYRLGSDWLRKHIFPGGHLPSLGAMVAAMAGGTRLNPVGLEDIGSHYVPTLAHWRVGLLARRQEVLALGFDETFLRRWTYYFSYCEAGFRTRLVRNYLLVLARMGEPVDAS
jgi:cyclopropane-fatty-acyl-phospholipid synthase